MLINRRIKEKKNKNLPFLKSCSTRAGYFNNLSLCQQDWIQASFFNIRRDINIKCEKNNRKSCENPMIWGDLFLVDIFIHMWIEWSYFWGKIYFQISYAILLGKKTHWSGHAFTILESVTFHKVRNSGEDNGLRIYCKDFSPRLLKVMDILHSLSRRNYRTKDSPSLHGKLQNSHY